MTLFGWCRPRSDSVIRKYLWYSFVNCPSMNKVVLFVIVSALLFHSSLAQKPLIGLNFGFEGEGFGLYSTSNNGEYVVWVTYNLGGMLYSSSRPTHSGKLAYPGRIWSLSVRIVRR